MRLRNAWLAVVGLTVAVAAGCSGSDPGPPDQSTLPDGAITLTANRPDRGAVEGLVLVTGNIDESGATLAGWNPSGDKPGGAGGRVDIGDTIDIEGITLRLVGTWVDPDPGVGDGGSDSEAWVVVESDNTPSSPASTAPSEE